MHKLKLPFLKKVTIQKIVIGFLTVILIIKNEVLRIYRPSLPNEKHVGWLLPPFSS